MAISKTTLVVGVDIAKQKHVARAVDERGIELGKECVFNQDVNGQNPKIKRETARKKFIYSGG